MVNLYYRAARLPSRVGVSLRDRGLSATCRLCLGRLFAHAHAWSPDQVRAHRSEAAFDRTHGTDTGGITALAGPETAAASKGWGVHHQAMNPWHFERILGQSPLDPHRLSFVDLGSGKGRAVLLASLHSFRAPTGVEFAGSCTRRPAETQRPGTPDTHYCHPSASPTPMPPTGLSPKNRS